MMRKSKKSFFTLLEVLVSMGVFMLLMLALMQFFSAAQGVWSRTGSKTSLYDSARIVMEIMANDLACAYYESNHGSDYLFFKIDKTDPKQVTFAAQTEAGNAEIFYKWDKSNWKLHRIEKEEEDQDFSTDVTWFTRSGKTGWISELSGTALTDSNCVAENILDFSVKAYKKGDLGTAIDVSSSATDKFPDVVIVSMTLLADDAYETLKTRIKNSEPDADPRTKIQSLYDEVKTALDSNVPPENEETDKAILYNGCLRLSRIITLDRGQND